MVNFNEYIKIFLLSKTHQRPIGDPHARSETNRRPTCLIGDSFDMLGQKRTFLMGDQYASSEIHQTCLIKYAGLQWVSNQAFWYPVRHVGLQWGMLVSNEACWSPIWHGCHQWTMLVFDEAGCSTMRHVILRWGMLDETCWSPMDLRSDMSSLQWVSDRSPIIIVFLWTPF